MGHAGPKSESQLSIGILKMDIDFIIYISRYTMETAMIVAAPILLTCVLVGVGITLIQTVTNIKDMSLTVAPKLMAISAVALTFGNWMLQVILRFTTEIFGYIQMIGK